MNLLIIGCSIGGIFLLIFIISALCVQRKAFKRRKEAIKRLRTHWDNLDKYI